MTQFGSAAIEQTWMTYVAPLKLGPYIKSSGTVEVGQWGMIPPDSKTSRPRLATNNARRERLAVAKTYKSHWLGGQRCLIAAESFVEPYYPSGSAKSISWRFARADGDAWALAGIWAEWTDPVTGEIVPSYSMITQNCDLHPLLKLMHKPEMDKDGNFLPMDQQDKRAVVPLERERWDEWLYGSVAQADALIQLPDPGLFLHGASDPAKNVPLPGAAAMGQMTAMNQDLF